MSAYTAWQDFLLTDPSAERPITKRLHVGFAAPSRAAVDGLWRAGVAAGHADGGQPGRRAQCSDSHYGAVLRDPLS